MPIWQRWLVLTAIAATLVGCGDDSAKQNNAPPAPAAGAGPPQAAPVAPGGAPAAVPAAAPASSQPAGGFQELLQYLPENLKVAAGVNIATLSDKSSSVGPRILAQFQPVTTVLARAGITMEQIERLWVGSNRETGDLLFCARTKANYDAAAATKGLGATAGSEKIGKATVQLLQPHGAYKNAVAYVDPKTILIGRYDTVSAALKLPKSGSVRNGIDALDQPDSFYWLAGDESMVRTWMGGGGAAASLVGEVYGDVTKIRAMGIGFGGSPNAPAPASAPPSPPQAIGRGNAAEAIGGMLSAVAQGPNIEFVMAMNYATEAAATSSETKLSQLLKGAVPGPAGAQPPRGNAPPRGRNIDDFQGLRQRDPGDDEDDRPVGLGRLGVVGQPGAGPASPAMPPRPAELGMQVQRVKENVRIGMFLPAGIITFLAQFMNEATLASGASALADGIFEGSLTHLSEALRAWPEARSEPLKGVRRVEGGRLKDGYSWMTELLPYLGHQGLYDMIDFSKTWSAPENALFPMTVIPAFINPADPRGTWQGFPGMGLGLTHFVGMSGVEDGRNVVAAELPRSDPRAGIFGYDAVARTSDISDGASQTILMIGAGEVVAPWVQGGGATIRGARAPYFGKHTGFGSRGTPRPGAYVLFADGSARMISAEIDPSVFKALCTMHGAEQIDMSKVLPQGEE